MDPLGAVSVLPTCERDNLKENQFNMFITVYGSRVKKKIAPCLP